MLTLAMLTLLTILTSNWSNPTLTAFPIWIQLYLNLTRHTSWNQPLKYPPPLPASVWFKPLWLRHFVFMFAYFSMLECVLLFLHLFVHLFYFCIFIYMCIFFNCASFLFVHLFYLCIFFICASFLFLHLFYLCIFFIYVSFFLFFAKYDFLRSERSQKM